MARKYQIIKKPIATASGEPGEWSFMAHGATYTKEEADAACAGSERYGYIVRRLAI